MHGNSAFSWYLFSPLNSNIGDMHFEYLSFSNSTTKTITLPENKVFFLILTRIGVSSTTAEGIFIGGTGSSNGHVNAFGTAPTNVTVTMSNSKTLSVTPSTSSMNGILIYGK